MKNRFDKVWKDKLRGKLFCKFIDKYLTNSSELVVLDAGCRYGAFIFELSKKFKFVYGIDISANVLAKLMKETKSVSNIEIKEESILKTNFKENSFDLVILEGVLEWVGLSNSQIPARKSQEIALKECKRILKKNGILFVGIENKMFPYHWFVDPHGYTPFTAILPKKLSIFLYKHLGKGYYGQNIFSFWGYHTLFNRIFKNCEILVPIPNYKYIYSSSQFNNRKLREKIKKIKNLNFLDLKNKILTNLLYIGTFFSLSKILCKDFIIICKKII
ncbi:MAG: methyltransferase domain-containing protein [Candidatus Hodarchaeota archaeon]